MNRLTTLGMTLNVLVSSASAQTSPIRIDPVKIDAVFKEYKTTTPGCAVGVYQRGKVLYAKGYGMADLGLGIPIRPTTVMDIGSTSKQFAAASIVLLANEGKLSLADDIRKYLPEIPDYGHPITIDHMLRHTSGIRDYNGLLYLAGYRFEDVTDDDDALQIIARQKALNFDPGTKWDYSNSGFFLLSVIVKRVTGKTLAEFAKERIFTPLGMAVSHFRVDHTAILPNRATAYSPGPKGGFVIDMSNWDQAGDGAVNTTVLELAKWDANFYNPVVGGRELVSKLEQRGTLNNGDSLGYARGQFVETYRGVRRISHGGSWAGYRAMLMRFPVQAIGIGVTCNVGDADTNALSEGVADVVLAAVLAKVPAAKAPGSPAGGQGAGSPADRAGTYFSEADQAVVEIATDSGKTVLKLFGRAFPLVAASSDRFTAVGAPIEVRFASSTELSLLVLGESQGTFLKVMPSHPTPADQAELAGTYRSEELGTTWTVHLAGGKAVLKSRTMGDNPLEPKFKDTYQAERGLLVFTRGPSGITGFNLSASRMQRIRFDRVP